jgi:hypothetical protein
MHTSRKRRIAKMVVFVLPAFVLFMALMIWAVYALWNGLMPEIFGLRAITYWQALGLMVLSWILFRGPRGPHMRNGGWRHQIGKRWVKMTPEEREEFIRGLNSRWAGERAGRPDPTA